jgi:site-specific DNA-methyltransferase (adenine-specific)
VGHYYTIYANVGRHQIGIVYDVYTSFPNNILFFAKEEQHTHPTQKPVPLLEYLIKTYTLPGQTVLDFTMGSGSTGVACAKTGRKFIGIELDPDYFHIAETRIKNAYGEFVLTDKEKETGQLALFGGTL